MNGPFLDIVFEMCCRFQTKVVSLSKVNKKGKG